MNRHSCLIVALALLAGCSKPTIATSGGCILVYRLQPKQTVRAEVMAVALQQRLRASGFGAANVSVQNSDVRIELPGSRRADAARVKALLTKPGHLEFLICAERGIDDAVIAEAEEAPAGAESAEKGYRWASLDSDRVHPDSKMVVRLQGGRQEVLMLVDDEFRITGADLKEAHATMDGNLPDGNLPCVAGTFSAEGGHKMGYVSGNNLKRRLGIALDGELLSAPLIQSKITNGFLLTGNFTQEEVDSIVAILRSGTLPGKLEEEPVLEEYVNPK
jgi:preprotein translocase subunit SecD